MKIKIINASHGLIKGRIYSASKQDGGAFAIGAVGKFIADCDFVVVGEL